MNKREVSEFYKGFGHRLRIARIALGLSEAQAAEIFGATVRAYRGWEAGNSGRPKRYEAYCDFCRPGISLDWLFGARGEMTKQVPGSKIAILPVVSVRTLSAERAPERGDVA